MAAEPRERRVINQGLFKALYISQDCDVERFELTEPFATLLDRNLLTDLAEERTGRRQAFVLADTTRTQSKKPRTARGLRLC